MSKTLNTFRKMKAAGDKITMITCYDYSMAKLMSEADLDILLIGDSLGMTIMGYPDTLSVTYGLCIPGSWRFLCDRGYAVYVLPDLGL